MSLPVERSQPVWLPQSSARVLSLAALVLFGLYASIVVGPLLPLQPLDPAWQLKLGAALINAAPFPLIGLALQHLAVELVPDPPLRVLRHAICMRLASAAALGFFLLIPLLSLAAVRQQQRNFSNQSNQLHRAEINLQALRQAVSRASSSSDLDQRLKALNGPQLDQIDRAQPLENLRVRVNAMLDQAADQFGRQRQALPSADPRGLLPELVRNGFACLLLAFGFAGMARR